MHKQFSNLDKFCQGVPWAVIFNIRQPIKWTNLLINFLSPRLKILCLKIGIFDIEGDKYKLALDIINKNYRTYDIMLNDLDFVRK